METQVHLMETKVGALLAPLYMCFGIISRATDQALTHVWSLVRKIIEFCSGRAVTRRAAAHNPPFGEASS
ncbi:hypothetical protein GCM10018987_31700 [Streptomyces cremeus]